MKRIFFMVLCLLFVSGGFLPEVSAQDKKADSKNKKPNILVIWGDDIGMTNLSYNSRGLMGYSTPNIDRIAKEGMIFTDYYGEQSCTAGRASFITGQSVIRTGLSKVGLPGADLGMQEEDPTIATVLKASGYVTGQFGKNHLGDKDEHLPTNHGFDEFYGNLYHLNAEEEPELPDYPSEEEYPGARSWSCLWDTAGAIVLPKATCRLTQLAPQRDKGSQIAYRVSDAFPSIAILWRRFPGGEQA